MPGPARQAATEEDDEEEAEAEDGSGDESSENSTRRKRARESSPGDEAGSVSGGEAGSGDEAVCSDEAGDEADGEADGAEDEDDEDAESDGSSICDEELDRFTTDALRAAAGASLGTAYRAGSSFDDTEHMYVFLSPHPIYTHARTHTLFTQHLTSSNYTSLPSACDPFYIDAKQPAAVLHSACDP